MPGGGESTVRYGLPSVSSSHSCPLAWVTAIGTRGVIVIDRVSGHSRATTTCPTCGTVCAEPATPARSTRASGVPTGTVTTDRTWAVSVSSAPVMLTDLTDNQGLKKTAYTAPAVRASTVSNATIHGQR